jgi:hypothetical protein
MCHYASKMRFVASPRGSDDRGPQNSSSMAILRRGTVLRHGQIMSTSYVGKKSSNEFYYTSYACRLVQIKVWSLGAPN